MVDHWWKTKDGRRIRIKEMDFGHLVHAVNMLYRWRERQATHFHHANHPEEPSFNVTILYSTRGYSLANRQFDILIQELEKRIRELGRKDEKVPGKDVKKCRKLKSP